MGAGPAPGELPDDPQVQANGYLAEVDLGDGPPLPMVASPVQFDEQPNQATPGPSTASTPRRCSSSWVSSWDEIVALKQRGAIL